MKIIIIGKIVDVQPELNILWLKYSLKHSLVEILIYYKRLLSLLLASFLIYILPVEGYLTIRQRGRVV